MCAGTEAPPWCGLRCGTHDAALRREGKGGEGRGREGKGGEGRGDKQGWGMGTGMWAIPGVCRGIRSVCVCECECMCVGAENSGWKARGTKSLAMSCNAPPLPPSPLSHPANVDLIVPRPEDADGGEAHDEVAAAEVDLGSAINLGEEKGEGGVHS